MLSPLSWLLNEVPLKSGCVEVVGCIKCEELQSWEELPEGVENILSFFVFWFFTNLASIKLQDSDS